MQEVHKKQTPGSCNRMKFPFFFLLSCLLSGRLNQYVSTRHHTAGVRAAVSLIKVSKFSIAQSDLHTSGQKQ